ncbi:MAG: class I SAM-dependent methyltransferase [Treponema sp.]|jgi:23S rRNA G2069 N7-methylase RlmK/C1962 C5-methylase RlmI|nr:class I SAM-dependent methyltransferase [Treponema sp.]
MYGRGRDITESEKTAEQSGLLYNRLYKRYKHLKKWARRIGTDAFRIYDRDIPEIPLLLELYGDAVSGALYKRPYEKDESEEENWLTVMRASVSKALSIDEGRIFLKERRRMRGRQDGEQYGKTARERSFFRDVSEGGLVFRVNLSDYIDTGLFLDARKKRALLRSEAAGKRVLNLFAYTCSLSVSAAKGGALRVDSVDLSNTYLDWGRINFALNGLEEPSLIRSDAFEFIAQAEKKGLSWDLILLDPPAFSNSKKMRGILDIKRDHREIINRCLSLLNTGGKLWFSSNAKGFTIRAEDFPGFTLKDMGPYLEDEDFRGKKMPLCYTFTEGNP